MLFQSLLFSLEIIVRVLVLVVQNALSLDFSSTDVKFVLLLVHTQLGFRDLLAHIFVFTLQLLDFSLHCFVLLNKFVVLRLKFGVFVC